ncbi:PTS transporter subunit IIC [Lactobacillus mulieris]|uniref:PTS glucitol transporter subunit IIA n=1 Tax=Lactobacillus mulieris TaxID=2508708 RepID=A0AAW5WY47_9LACO|nr:PTS transporter subunit IIC [Lactobacillus mulieris]MCZ3622214.1 PTS glucitol transporter subunit IIA [Lactobacillus mulieris]MCZ3623996.1 PTS glucitol transporter subunit IIA [Lactobacillus mulieris]MCZ3636221.1 PTS glucitol transporter subunit IIA [Lactobacillus mulieris]MCZ3689765.1 PTS glucitol transporter subunit IIA [Lactobacillus mulieris]MCZ3695768.1 PTS glucitol transporter subunit IIA [Lactobacillus mulieris]
MNVIIDFANGLFKPLIDMGAPTIMLVVLSLIAICFKVKFSKAVEGGLKLAIALTAIGNVMNMLTTAFQGPMKAFVTHTGIRMDVQDMGWAPLATITWGSPYTLFFLLVLIILNVILLVTKKTNTLDVDIFDVWHLAFVGLFAQFCGAPLWLATVLVLLIGTLKIINSDLMKPTFDDLLQTSSSNPMTTTHMNYMMNPIIMVFNKFFDKFLSGLDKYDFDSAKLNEKIGFWGSRFAIGVYLGIFVSLLAGTNFATEDGWKSMFTLSFVAGSCIELFSVIGSWFIASVEPLSQGISNFATSKFKGRTFNVGLDWPFIAGRSEMWAAANILAPIMMIEAIFLPGNRIMPLGGIIAMGVTPALLVVTRGKIIRMIIIGTIELPIFLWAGTLVAPFVTSVAHQVGANIPANTLVSHSTMEGPVEKFLGYLVGNAWKQQGMWIVYALLALAAYLLLFWWYAKEMKKRNAEYAEQNANN